MSFTIEQQAFISQGSANRPYPGVDDWKDDVLNVGEIIAQFDFRSNEDIVLDDCPMTVCFFHQNLLNEAFDVATQTVNVRQLGAALKVAPYKNIATQMYEYSPRIVSYEVLKPLPVVKSPAANNLPYFDEKYSYPVFTGPDQYRTGLGHELLVKNGFLKRCDIIETVNREHEIYLFKVAQENSLSRSKLNEMLSEWQKNLIQDVLDDAEED